MSINIRIRCSVQSLSEELLEGVSEDLDQLSKKLHRVTKEILRDINQGSKSLTLLKTSTTPYLKQIDQVLQQAKTTV